MPLANAALVGILSAAVALLLAAHAREPIVVVLVAPLFAAFVGFGAALCVAQWARVIQRHQQAKPSQDGPDGNGASNDARRARPTASAGNGNGFHGAHTANREPVALVGRAFTHGGNGAVNLTRRAIRLPGKSNTEERGEA
jgi:hypothetical protein